MSKTKVKKKYIPNQDISVFCQRSSFFIWIFYSLIFSKIIILHKPLYFLLKVCMLNIKLYYKWWLRGFMVSQNLLIYLIEKSIFFFTRCLKIDATRYYDNALLLRQAQWSLFGTGPVKNVSFELETSTQCFCYLLYQFPGHAIFILVFVSEINHYHINDCINFETVSNDFVSSLVVIQMLFLCCPRHCDQILIVVIV